MSANTRHWFQGQPVPGVDQAGIGATKYWFQGQPAPLVSTGVSYNLTPDVLSHLQTIGVSAFSTGTTLAPASLSHLHALSIPILSVGLSLTPAVLAHLHSLGVPVLVTGQFLGVEPLTHLHTLSIADILALTGNESFIYAELRLFPTFDGGIALEIGIGGVPDVHPAIGGKVKFNTRAS